MLLYVGILGACVWYMGVCFWVEDFMHKIPKIYMSDLQAVKIRLVCFLGMFHVRQLRIKLLKFQ